MSFWQALKELDAVVNPNAGKGRGRKVSAKRKLEIEAEKRMKEEKQRKRLLSHIKILDTGTKQVPAMGMGGFPLFDDNGDRVSRTVVLSFSEQLKSLYMVLRLGLTPEQVSTLAPSFRQRLPEALTPELLTPVCEQLKKTKGYANVKTEDVLECCFSFFEIKEGEEEEEGEEFELNVGEDDPTWSSAA